MSLGLSMLPAVLDVTPVETPWGTFEVSTNSDGATVAFGPEGEQVDFGYAPHGRAVIFMRCKYAAREGEEYVRVRLTT